MALRPDYPLRTARLDLRPFEPDDVDAVLAYSSRADSTRFLAYAPQDREQVERRIADGARVTTIEREGDGINLAIVRRDTGELAGDIALEWTSERQSCVSVGYVLHPDHRGHGFATEAANEILRLAFDELGARKVTAEVDERNDSSAAVLRRLGMREETRTHDRDFKDERVTTIEFGLLDSEWRGRP